MNDEQINKLFETLGEIKGKQEQILKKQDRICLILDKHEKKIEEIEVTTTRHSTYFKVMGILSGLAATLATMWTAIKSFFQH